VWLCDWRGLSDRNTSFVLAMLVLQSGDLYNNFFLYLLYIIVVDATHQ